MKQEFMSGASKVAIAATAIPLPRRRVLDPFALGTYGGSMKAALDQARVAAGWLTGRGYSQREAAAMVASVVSEASHGR